MIQRLATGKKLFWLSIVTWTRESGLKTLILAKKTRLMYLPTKSLRLKRKTLNCALGLIQSVPNATHSSNQPTTQKQKKRLRLTERSGITANGRTWSWAVLLVGIVDFNWRGDEKIIQHTPEKVLVINKTR